MKKFLGFVLSLSLVAAFTAPTRTAHAEETTGDFAVTVLDTVKRWRGGTSSPLEDALRVKLEQLSAAEQGGGGSGFEAPPEGAGKVPEGEDDDTQFAALQDLMKKMGPLERVKTGVWFLVIRPNTSHRQEVQRTIERQAQALSPAEKAAFQEYMTVRKSIGAASYKKRQSRWKEFAKSKTSSPFAELAQREAQYLESLQQDRSNEKKKGFGRVMVVLGISVVLIALLGVIIFGAAK